MKTLFFSMLLSGMFISPVLAQDDDDDKPRKEMEIYGFVMTDAGYNFNQIHPDWFDVVRPTKLPSFDDQYGSDGNVYFSVRQTRFGVKNWFCTKYGELKTTFEFEMFGTGVDAGQTTIRLRHAYGELGKFGAGQYWSPFMDIDVFPNTVEYWGPSGMVFFRNVQIRYMPIQGDSRLTIALERPGASGDQGRYADRIELTGIAPRFPLPDLSAEYRFGGRKWGYVELAGIVRRIEWEDHLVDPFDLSGDAWGWGLHLSTNIKFGKNTTFRGSFVYGEGIENYMNDAPADIGIKNNLIDSAGFRVFDPVRPIIGVPLPVLGVVAFVDHNWSKRFSSSLGYSLVEITPSDGQADDAFQQGQYIVGNLLYYPTENAMAGIEYQWGARENNRDGFGSVINKVQLSFKYNFSRSFYEKRRR